MIYFISYDPGTLVISDGNAYFYQLGADPIVSAFKATPTLSPSPNLYNVQNVYNNNVRSF